VIALANGSSQVRISDKGRDYNEFCQALEEVCSTLTVEMVRDGEGELN
jgi:N-acetylglutamate synthase/N-acetylornithine aminotransferase